MHSSSQNVTNNKPIPSFLQTGCPLCRPTNSLKALKGNGKNHRIWTHNFYHLANTLPASAALIQFIHQMTLRYWSVLELTGNKPWTSAPNNNHASFTHYTLPPTNYNVKTVCFRWFSLQDSWSWSDGSKIVSFPYWTISA